MATQNQKIFMAKLSDVNQIDLEKNLQDLKRLVVGQDKGKIVDTLKKFIPYYKL